VSDAEPISLYPGFGAGGSATQTPRAPSPGPALGGFNRRELAGLLDVYGRQVAAGGWRDYALGPGRGTASLSHFRRAYSVVSATGLILKRGNELDRVLAVIDRKIRVVV